MRLAIMQPYFFPYPGYYELINSVDLFVLFDDVQYIRRGWVNRNRIKNKKGWQYITVPVAKHKQTSRINEIMIADDWTNKHLAAFRHNYPKSNPAVIEFYKELSSWKMLSPLLEYSIRWTCSHIGIETEMINSSELPSEINKGEDRIISICKRLGATTYVNLPGGKNLYHKDKFESEGIELEFMPPTTIGNLSILDNCLNESHFRINARTQQTSCPEI